jgi:hypothetical protein
MAARHGCDNQYGRKSSVFNHHKTCQFNVAKVSARSGHRFVTVVDLEEEDVPTQPPTIGAPAVRTRSTSDKTDLELREFVNGTDVTGRICQVAPRCCCQDSRNQIAYTHSHNKTEVV